MQYTNLGDTDIPVSKICLGTMMYGDQVSEKEAHRHFDYALERGVNFWDTAEVYTIPIKASTWGNTERYIGTYFAKNPSVRQKIILATKVTAQSRVGMEHVRGGDLSLIDKNIRRALQGSLERLQTEYVDLYQIHWPDRPVNKFGQKGYETDMGLAGAEIFETLQTLDALVQEGKIRSIGLSNETPWGFMQFLCLAKEHGFTRIVSIQNPYSLLNRLYEVGLSEMSIRENCGLLAYSTLGFGVLTGKYLQQKNPTGSRRNLFPGYFERYSSASAVAATEAYVALAQNLGISPATMALAFVNNRDFVTSNIIGATTMAQLKENIDSIDVVLSVEAQAAINKIHDQWSNPSP